MKKNNRRLRTMDLIHYGHQHFEIGQFLPARFTQDMALQHLGFSKPSGGFWACPINAKLSIKDWCKQISSSPKQLRTSVKVRFVGVVYTINAQTTIWDVIHMIEGCAADAIHLPDTQLNHRHFTNWDCDTMFIINPNSITERR